MHVSSNHSSLVLEPEEVSGSDTIEHMLSLDDTRYIYNECNAIIWMCGVYKMQCELNSKLYTKKFAHC